MYRVCVSTKFVATHLLTVVDSGPESVLHAHEYSLTVEVAGPSLDANGYLVDIDILHALLGEFAEIYRDSTLNEHEAFAEINPSIEHFARIACVYFRSFLPSERIREITVIVGEDNTAEASYTLVD